MKHKRKARRTKRPRAVKVSRATVAKVRREIALLTKLVHKVKTISHSLTVKELHLLNELRRKLATLPRVESNRMGDDLDLD